jgi:hypothetical protein
MLGTPLQPLDALLWPLREPQFAIEFGYAETVHGAGMDGRRGFAIELDGLGGFSSASPAILAARSGTVCGIWMSMFRGKHEEGEGAIEILPALDGADAVRITVC